MAKNPAAVELGRRGGKARLKKMTPEQRKAVARKAVNTRWAKFRETEKKIKEGMKRTKKIVDQSARRLKRFESDSAEHSPKIDELLKKAKGKQCTS